MSKCQHVIGRKLHFLHLAFVNLDNSNKCSVVAVPKLYEGHFFNAIANFRGVTNRLHLGIFRCQEALFYSFCNTVIGEPSPWIPYGHNARLYP